MASVWSSVALLLCSFSLVSFQLQLVHSAASKVPSSREEVIASFQTWVDSVSTKHAAFENAATTASNNIDDLSSKVGEAVIVVDQSGAGNYKTINEAINAVPLHNKNPITIKVNAGTYV